MRLDPHDFANQSEPRGSRSVEISIAGAWNVSARDVRDPVEFHLRLQFTREATVSGKIVSANIGWLDEKVAIQSHLHSEFVGEVRLGRHTYPIFRCSGLAMGTMHMAPTNDGIYFVPLEQALLAPKTLVRNMRFVPAIRGFSRGTYSLGSELQDVLVSGTGLSAQEENTATAMAYSPNEVGQVSNWMQKVTGVGLKTDLVPPLTIKPVSVTPTGQPNLLAEGSGTNSLVLLLFELARAGGGDTILIEEPEIHLHPKAQAELASVIINEATSANKQVIMATHSEHIAGRIMTEIAEGNVSAAQVAIYSFDKDADGVCSVDRIELNDTGQATGGLRNFFQTDLDEMRRYVDALRAKA